MSKLFYKALIENCEHAKCTTQEMDDLISVYSNTVKRMATTLARKAWYELQDFSGTKEKGIAGFSLLIERKMVKGEEQFVGYFEHGKKNLKLIAMLKKV